MPVYTVFCIEKSREGTTWIAAVKADDPEHAWRLGREQCAEDWGFSDPSSVHVLGVAEGNVQILEWHD